MVDYPERTNQDNRGPRYSEGVSGPGVPLNYAAVIEAQAREAEFWQWRAVEAARVVSRRRAARRNAA